jgi:two-component system chemotaxis response regulator CheB
VPNTKVLVVDDSALMRKALKSMLTDAGGFEVFLARNGADALDQIPRIHPDVVTLDINMPEMDGLTCLAAIMRDHPVPVVMVSSLTERGALVTLEALELGAVDYVEKPGGTVSMNMAEVTAELVAKTRVAAHARVRVGGLRSRIRQANEMPATRVASSPSSRSVVPAARPSSSRRVDLVVIGASTGGPGLLADVLSRLPSDTHAAVVIAQHMPESFTGTLARRIDATCPLPVQEVRRVTAIQPGHVYVARGGADMIVTRRSDGLAVRLTPSSTTRRWHPSVDRLMESALAVVDPRRLVGVLLTGMGDDGAQQMTLLRAQGGRTIAESEESAVVWGMPGELVARGGATLVLHADKIAASLASWL